MRRIVCVSGKRFSGKDSFAARMCEFASQRGVSVATYAFADVSKRMLVESQRARGVEVDLGRLIHDRAYKESWRPALTQRTVEALAADPEVFVRDVAGRIAADPRPALVTDLRLRPEHDFLAARFDVVLVRLVRSDQARAASGWRYDPIKDQHHTETDLDDPSRWNVIVRNDGTESDLAAEAERVARDYLLAPDATTRAAT